MSKIAPPPGRAAIVVVGSLNVDLIASVKRLPRPGETVGGLHLERRFGGKGANQAVAAARHGGDVSLIGCVGDDSDGSAYLKHLRTEGISAKWIQIVRGETTGTALIAVDAKGENEIIVMAGANGVTKPAQVHRAARLIRRARALLVQLEAPLPAVLEAMRLANAAGVPVIFNPSPLAAEFPWGQVELHSVIVNAGEARHLFQRSLRDSAARWRLSLRQNRISRLIVTRGRLPTLAIAVDVFQTVPTLRVKPVDTVGAGDAFAGTYAAALAAGAGFLQSVEQGNRAGAMATLKHGAQ